MHTSPRLSARRAQAANQHALRVWLTGQVTATSPLAHAARAALVGVLSTLIVVLPVPFRRSVARADPADVTLDSESFNFPSQSASSDEGSTASASANALKQRTSPVTASGSFSTSVAIELPPGRGSMTPSLELAYVSDSFRSDSPVGAGWSLGVPSISRDASEGFPSRKVVSRALRYDDDKARFVGPSGRMARFTGSEGLAATAGSWLFVPEREHTPVRYEYVAAQDRWVEHLPTGVKRYYGAVDNRAGRVVDELGTSTWLLLKERDADGNTIEYGYHNLDGDLGQVRPGSWTSAQAEPVLKSIRWGANDVAGTGHVFRRRGRVFPATST